MYLLCRDLAIKPVLAISTPVSYSGGPGVRVLEKLKKRQSHNKVIPRILRRPGFITAAKRAPSDPYVSHTKSRRCNLNTPNCNWQTIQTKEQCCG